jgi:hypothetical protein
MNVLRGLKNTFRSKKKEQEFRSFHIIVELTSITSFQICYPLGDYTPRIEEYTGQQLKKRVSFQADKSFYFKLFITNPLGLDNLECFLKVEELNGESEIIAAHTRVYSVEKGYQNWNWVSFEI